MDNERLCNSALPASLGGCGGPAYTEGPNIVGNLIGQIAALVLILGSCLAFAYLLTGAVAWITSNGDKGQLESARNKITHAIIGLIILAATYAIFTLVGNFLGINTGGSEFRISLPTLAE